MIFQDKYRPKEFDDIIGMGDKIKDLCSTEDIPHLLFYGKPGTGKSSSVRVIVEKLGLQCFELKGYKERGVDLLRKELLDYAMSASMNGKIKIILINEFDIMTNDFYEALKDFMEQFQKTTRFIVTLNNIHRIPDAIKSRFTDIEFKNPEMQLIHHNLKSIAEIENIDIDDDCLIELIQNCKNDVRKCFNRLELLSKLDRKIELSDLKRDTELVEKIHSLLKQRNFPDARQVLLDASMKAEDFMNDYHEYLMDLAITKKELSPDVTKKLIERFFESIAVLRGSANQDIVVEWLLLKIMELL